MTKYHVDFNTGDISSCSAFEKFCPLLPLDEHCDTPEQAQKLYDDRVQVLEAIKASKPTLSTPNRFSHVLEEAVDRESFCYEKAEDLVNRSLVSFRAASDLVAARAALTSAWDTNLLKLDPSVTKTSPHSKKSVTEARKTLTKYREHTAILLESLQASPFYVSRIKDVTPDRIGQAVLGTQFDSGTTEWLQQRFDSVGGSDVGMLATIDFANEEDLSSSDKSALKKVETSKLVMYQPKERPVNAGPWVRHRRGAFYRGNVWESQIREIFAENHPELTVYNAKSQYFNPERSWQQVNFDGLVSNREDGVPNGLLEIKTGSDPSKWENGVPLGYRIQVLYCLNATGFDYAHVSVAFNDGDIRDFMVHANERVAPSEQFAKSYDKDMESYIQERVTPWFESLVASRV